MHTIYIDDSRDEDLCVVSALVIPAENWHPAFDLVRDWRKSLRDSDGIFVYKELHAWKLVSGRGRISPAGRPVPKGRRCAIFREGLAMVATLPGVEVINACFPVKQEAVAYERVLNRLHVNMEHAGSYGIHFWDEGKEHEYRRLTRRMGVYNPIPSKFGSWEDGQTTKNIPTSRLIEDPVFKDSAQSYFIQLADFTAYALLRRENPVASKTRYGIDRAFGELDSVLCRAATGRDPEGILRP